MNRYICVLKWTLHTPLYTHSCIHAQMEGDGVKQTDRPSAIDGSSGLRPLLDQQSGHKTNWTQLSWYEMIIQNWNYWAPTVGWGVWHFQNRRWMCYLAQVWVLPNKSVFEPILCHMTWSLLAGKPGTHGPGYISDMVRMQRDVTTRMPVESMWGQDGSTVAILGWQGGGPSK